MRSNRRSNKRSLRGLPAGLGVCAALVCCLSCQPLSAEEPSGTLAESLSALKLGDSTEIPALLWALDTDDDSTVAQINGALAEFARSKTDEADLLSAMFSLQSNASVNLKCRFADMLGVLNSAGAERVLANLLYDPEPVVRCSALRGLSARRPSQRAAVAAASVLRVPAQNPMVLRDACAALSALRYTEAIPDLIRLLGSDNAVVKSSAAQALGALTGLSYPPDAARWQSWWDTEKEQAPQTLAQHVRQLRADPVHAPLRLEQWTDVISQRRQLVDVLLPLLRHADFRVRAASCNVLAQCGDERALVPLAAALANADANVSYGAWRALKFLTGRQLPREASAWSAWIAERN